jgi:molybdenum cofactor guanylyltransferase
MKTPLVVILAGGEGRRIGGAKPLRTLGGERLIDRAAGLAGLWSDDVRVALRTPGQLGRSKLPVLLDEPTIMGPLAGLFTALRACAEAGRGTLLTIPCDAPFLPHDLLDGLNCALGKNLVAVATSGSVSHPTCALWRCEALQQLPTYLQTGRRSLIGFAKALGFATAAWDEAYFCNINCPEDLQKAEDRLD